MQAKGYSVGLCLTCNNADTCAYRESRGADAIFCEMFDNYVARNGEGKKEAAPVVVMTRAAVESSSPKGLCVNCAHRDACRLFRPETGVWHCEEFE